VPSVALEPADGLESGFSAPLECGPGFLAEGRTPEPLLSPGSIGGGSRAAHFASCLEAITRAAISAVQGSPLTSAPDVRRFLGGFWSRTPRALLLGVHGQCRQGACRPDGAARSGVLCVLVGNGSVACFFGCAMYRAI